MIVHACSSVLVRPNGIVRYINTVMDFQKQMGHDVAFVTDSHPTQRIHTDAIFHARESSTYVPNFQDGHVWLQIDQDVISQIKQAHDNMPLPVDLIIAHDLHSYLALREHGGIFIQHESDVLNRNGRYSFLSDEYLEMQIACMDDPQWRMGFTSRRDELMGSNGLLAPIPFEPRRSGAAERTRGLLYVGDSTERKGAGEFMSMARDLGVRPVVITHDPDSEIFNGAEIHSFALEQKDEMMAVMATCCVAYLPSRNETLCLAALECMQFMPVVVNLEHEWTSALEEPGAFRIATRHRKRVLGDFLAGDGTNPRHTQLMDWCQKSRQTWADISNGVQG